MDKKELVRGMLNSTVNSLYCADKENECYYINEPIYNEVVFLLEKLDLVDFVYTREILDKCIRMVKAAIVFSEQANYEYYIELLGKFELINGVCLKLIIMEEN